MVRTLSGGVVEDKDQRTKEGGGEGEQVAWGGDGKEVVCRDEGYGQVTRPLGANHNAADAQPYAALLRPQREKNHSGSEQMRASCARGTRPVERACLRSSGCVHREAE